MAQPEATSARAPEEKTFRAYNKEDGKNYARTRADYHPSVYQTVIDQHASTGGQHNMLVDIGCGPGGATRVLAPHFAHVIGLDASPGMIDTARGIGGTSSTGEAIRWEVNSADDLGAGLQPVLDPGTVDLIVAANAAHWFDMAGFWRAAARQLRPGGSVAIWTSGEIRVHPSMPNAAAIQEALDRIDEEHLRAHMEPGNNLVRNSYRDLPLPWTLDPPVSEFDRASFFRKDWEVDEEFFVIGAVDMPTVEKMMGTGSHVTRWREAHPDDVGTERDITAVIRRTIEHHLHEAGVPKGEERMRGAVKGVMLIVKKKADS